MKSLVPVLLVPLALVVSCGKSDAEKACANALKLDTSITQADCMQALATEQKGDPAQYAKDVTCMANAATESSLRGCVADRLNQQAASAMKRENEAQVNGAQDQIEKLKAKLAVEKDPAEIASLQAQLANAESKRNALSPPSSSTKPPCKCAPGDPLCSCP
jgi:hypothetical protein